MNDVICPRCGASVPPNAAFCGMCGAPITAQQAPEQPVQQPPEQPVQQPAPPPADGNPQQGWQQIPASQPPPNPALPPTVPGYFPPPGSAPKFMGDNTKWALGLGIASLFCCGPITGIIGIILAKKDMDEIASGRAPLMDDTWAKGAFYLNIVALVLFVFGICMFWGVAGLRRF